MWIMEIRAFTEVLSLEIKVSTILLSLSSKMSVTNDDQFLLTASEDGSILIWKVYDKEGGVLKREKEVEYAEEVLIMRSDIEEKVGGATCAYEP